MFLDNAVRYCRFMDAAAARLTSCRRSALPAADSFQDILPRFCH